MHIPGERMTKDKLIRHVFCRKHHVEFYQKHKRRLPKSLWLGARLAYQEIIEIGDQMNFNVKKYMRSAEGKVKYLEYCVNLEQTEKNIDRCIACKNFDEAINVCSYGKDTETTVVCDKNTPG